MKPIRQQKAQGDVLFSPAALVGTPKGKVRAAPLENGRYIFARGEVTGHHHSAAPETCTLNLDEGGVMWLTVEQLTEVVHQEHAVQVLEPGIYRVDLQKEADAWDGWRPVAD